MQRFFLNGRQEIINAFETGVFKLPKFQEKEQSDEQKYTGKESDKKNEQKII